MFESKSIEYNLLRHHLEYFALVYPHLIFLHQPYNIWIRILTKS